MLSRMGSMRYHSSQLITHLRHTFNNFNLHYCTILIYHLLKSFPYSIFLNHFISKTAYFVSSKVTPAILEK